MLSILSSHDAGGKDLKEQSHYVKCRGRESRKPSIVGSKYTPHPTYGFPGVFVSLVRRIRRAGHSVAVSLPSQLAEMAGQAEGDFVEFKYLGQGTLRIAKRQM